MELHPILEIDTVPSPGLWYVMSAFGECPSMRVGASCTYVPGKTSTDNGCLYVIGGANPSGPFCDTYSLDLNILQWDMIDSPGFRARYEHAAFVPQSQPSKIYIFGGADQTGNMNDIQVFDADSQTWSSVTVKGTPPSERTYHTTSACVGDRFIVYSGGHCGPDPVTDRQVHCFDVATLTWKTLNVKGDCPKPRHGHVTVAVGNKVYVHGGMSGTNFYNDLHMLNLEKNSWCDVKRKKTYPSARAGHSAVAIETNVFIFGGMNRDGALDETYKFDTCTSQWTKLDVQGPPPASRLDFGMCIVPLRRSVSSTDTTPDVINATRQAQDVLEREMTKPGSASSRGSCPEFGAIEPVVSNSGNNGMDAAPPGQAGDPGADNHDTEGSGADNFDDVDGATACCPGSPAGDQKMFRVCLVQGGMDTEGEVFDDILVLNLEHDSNLELD